MRISLSPRPSDASADVVVVPVFDDRRPGPGAADAAVGVDLVAALRSAPRFHGRVEDAPLVIPPSAAKRATVIVVGVGPRERADSHAIREAALRAGYAVRGRSRVALALGRVGADPAAAVRAAIEGFLLGSFQRPRPDAAPRPAYDSVATSLVVLVERAVSRRPEVRDALTRGQVVGERTLWVRTLTDTPANQLTPTQLADEIVRDAAEAGYVAVVWSAAEIRERGFGGLLAVAKGSAEEPRVVELRHGDERAPIGLVGKGITFDSGGINLKASLGHFYCMKTDMESAAAVAGAVSTVARLRLDVSVRAILPLTENMPSGSATRPGDVIRHPNGLTTEVTDTDCEGRLVLADGIAHLAKEGVSGIVDIGTLTDAAGYGPALFAVASTDATLAAEVLAAGEESGERGWPLPLVASYVELMRSQVADLINGPLDMPDSSVLAATYLREFAGSTPWVHIDVGSTAWLEQAWGGFPIGPTASPMRTLVRLLEKRASGRDGATDSDRDTGRDGLAVQIVGLQHEAPDEGVACPP
jgi:leucyl aminopeptidase